MTGVAGNKDRLDLRRVLLILRAVGAQDAGDEPLLLAQLCGADIADRLGRSAGLNDVICSRWRAGA
jgi:tetraacyldisaccharide-1-P 4'-kinase